MKRNKKKLKIVVVFSIYKLENICYIKTKQLIIFKILNSIGIFSLVLRWWVCTMYLLSTETTRPDNLFKNVQCSTMDKLHTAGYRESHAQSRILYQYNFHLGCITPNYKSALWEQWPKDCAAARVKIFGAGATARTMPHAKRHIIL